MAKRFGTPGEGGNAGYSAEELQGDPYFASDDEPASTSIDDKVADASSDDTSSGVEYHASQPELGCGLTLPFIGALTGALVGAAAGAVVYGAVYAYHISGNRVDWDVVHEHGQHWESYYQTGMKYGAIILGGLGVLGEIFASGPRQYYDNDNKRDDR